MQKYNELKKEDLQALLKKMEIPFSKEELKPALWEKYKDAKKITENPAKPSGKSHGKVITGYRYQLRLKRYVLNSGNIVITNDGRGNTFKLTDVLARRIIAKGHVHLLDIIPIYG